MKKITFAQTLRILATNVRRIRKLKKLTQLQMAQRGFNYRYYQKIESGVYSPNLKTLHRLSEVFNITVSELFQEKS